MTPALEQLCDAYARQLAGKDRAFCQQHPLGNPNSWCAQELLEHLILTWRSTDAYLERYLAQGSPTRTRPRWKHRLIQIPVLKFGYFPSGRQAPDFTLPGLAGLSPMDGDELCTLMRSELERLDTQIQRCQQAFGGLPIASHFVFGPLTVEQWRRFHVVHGKHHLAQLARIHRRTAAAPGRRRWKLA